jgi:hypothetical protein
LQQADMNDRNDRNDRNERNEAAIAILDRFAERSGLTSARTPQRYLWTDALAACTWLGLARATGESHCLDLALQMIEAVHATLGRHRPDDSRRGWLSGFDDEQARLHPTFGGLRIGKPWPERDPHELVDVHGEMERDGQYFHYLTKWMCALDLATRATGEWQFNVWARELAVRAFDAFSYVDADTGTLRLYWKMSIDLTRAAVSAPGQHDPLDGYATYTQLAATAELAPPDARLPTVDGQADDLFSAIEVGALHTADPLGIGGLLIDAARIMQLDASVNDRLAAFVLSAAASGLADHEREGVRRRPAGLRLPFRELGLAVGLRGRGLVAERARTPAARDTVRLLARYAPVADEIEEFWRDRRNQEAATWTAHRDINDVTLAAALAPAGMTELPLPPRSGDIVTPATARSPALRARP